jgi:hypothetical protein
MLVHFDLVETQMVTFGVRRQLASLHIANFPLRDEAGH